MIDIKNGNKGVLYFIAKNRALGLLAIVILLSVIFSVLYPETFGTYNNFTLILLNMSSEFPVVIAITLVLIMGEIDLSLGSSMVLGGVLVGRLMKVHDVNMWLAMIITLAVALICGLINGLIITKFSVVSFIGTLATGMVYTGVAIMLAGTGWTNFPDETFKALGQNRLLGIQMPVFYMIIVAVLFTFLLERTRYFRQLYYIGQSTKAAELSGINVYKTKIIMFIISAILGCIAGIVTAMRFNAASTSIGAGVEMRAVTAAVIGGVSFTGGAGTFPGAVMGALFVALMNNILVTAGVSANLQSVVTGIILILAIVIDILISKKNK